MFYGPCSLTSLLFAFISVCAQLISITILILNCWHTHGERGQIIQGEGEEEKTKGHEEERKDDINFMKCDYMIMIAIYVYSCKAVFVDLLFVMIFR